MTARDTDWDGVRLHVVTGKGGTGKTTVAAALALALAHAGRKILLIEAEGRQGIARLFDRPPLPYQERKIAIGPGEADDGRSAIDQAAVLSPDLILLDVQLPDIDGFEVATRLTSVDRGPAVVLVSSHDGGDFGANLPLDDDMTATRVHLLDADAVARGAHDLAGRVLRGELARGSRHRDGVFFHAHC